ncbi:MAG: M1 family metallopeptidase [Ignavibacteria bacterium]|nr:M1 family metallopeptidase [Ignavibacteria bacterium]
MKNKIEFISSAEKNINLVMSLKDINEDFIAEYNVKSQRSLDVLHYKISIELLPDEKKIKGDVTLTIKVVNPDENVLSLNFYDNLKINSAFIGSKKVKYDRSETNISIYPDEKLLDTILVRLIYEGEPKSLGFGSFNFDEINGKKLIYTLNEPIFASTWFPCVDRPDDKALADIYITNDSSFVSLSNGKLIGSTINGNKKTFHWKTYYPISTYLIALYSGYYKSYSQKYISISKDTVDLFCYALPDKFEDAVRDFKGHERYLKTFEEIFGFYPFPKEKYSVAQFNWVYGAMEHQTITGIGTDFISGMKLFQDMIIHELAHQWWGNAVGPKTWKDIWLNEGFSTYSEALYWEKQSGYDALKTTLTGKFGTFNNGTLYNPDKNLFSTLVYDKGAWVLHMLRKEVGDTTFFKIIRNYYDRFKYKNASTKDFQTIAEEFSRKNLSDFFNQWVFKGVGIIEANFQYKTEKINNGFKTEIKLKQLQNGYDIYKFPIDIKFVYENDSETKEFYVTKREESFTFESMKKPLEIILDPDKWLLANFEINKSNDGR